MLFTRSAGGGLTEILTFPSYFGSPLYINNDKSLRCHEVWIKKTKYRQESYFSSFLRNGTLTILRQRRNIFRKPWIITGSTRWERSQKHSFARGASWRIFWTLLKATVAKNAILIKFLGVKFNFAKVSCLIPDLPWGIKDNRDTWWCHFVVSTPAAVLIENAKKWPFCTLSCYIYVFKMFQCALCSHIDFCWLKERLDFHRQVKVLFFVIRPSSGLITFYPLKTDKTERFSRASVE